MSEVKEGYKLTKVGIIPEDWETRTLGDLADIKRGASPRPIDSPIWFDDQSPTGWVRISDVTRSGMYLEKTIQYLSPEGIKHSRPVKSGELIMSICATVGRPIITNLNVCIHDGFVHFGNLEIDRHFTYYVLKKLEPEWAKEGQTGSQMNLNTDLIIDNWVSCWRGIDCWYVRGLATKAINPTANGRTATGCTSIPC